MPDSREHKVLAMSKLDAGVKAIRAEHMAEHPHCWLCRFMGRKPAKAELHHIAGRGRNHEVRQNYASLCREHHAGIQSRTGAELLCLVLKKRYDREHYSPETVGRLRGRVQEWITDYIVTSCGRVLCLVLFDLLPIRDCKRGEPC